MDSRYERGQSCGDIVILVWPNEVGKEYRVLLFRGSREMARQGQDQALAHMSFKPGLEPVALSLW